MPSSIRVRLVPVSALPVSNVFMTFAWYGHLSYPNRPSWPVVTASRGIAFFEYGVAVPADRRGHAFFSAVELKTIQEVVTLLVFAGFSTLWLKEPLGWNHLLGFVMIAGGAALIFQKW